MSQPHYDPRAGAGKVFVARRATGVCFLIQPDDCTSHGMAQEWSATLEPEETYTLTSTYLLRHRSRGWLLIALTVEITYLDICYANRTPFGLAYDLGDGPLLYGDCMKLSPREAAQWLLAHGGPLPSELTQLVRLNDEPTAAPPAPDHTVPAAGEPEEQQGQPVEAADSTERPDGPEEDGEGALCPEMPTREYCLSRNRFIRWEGEVKVRPQLWQLCGCLLDQHCWPVPFRVVENPVWGRDAQDKAIQNTVSELDSALTEIRFPWHVRTADGHIYRD